MPRARTTLSALAVTLTVVVLLAVPWLTQASSETPADDGGALSLSLSDSSVGYIAATIDGVAGVTVSLGGQRPDGVHPITDVVLPASGTLRLPRLLKWSCTSGPRIVVASVGTPPSVTTTASITTPSCATRLRVQIPPSARVGHSAQLEIRDTWRIGGAPLTLCVTAPGASASCRTSTLPDGHATATVRVATSRPGGWIITAHTVGGNPHQRTIWVSHPDHRLTLLAAGDSEMQVLDADITDDLAPHGVQVTSDAHISTGLTNPILFNWQREAQREATHLSPDVSVVFLGANEGFGIPAPGGGTIDCCGADWATAYARLVRQMASTLLRGDAGRVYWFVLPTPKPANFQRVFNAVNAGIRQAAGWLPGRMALIDANAFFTPHNVYRNRMTYAARRFTIHEPDGIHLDAASDQIAAAMFVRQLIADRVIR